jgi:hypothetical protein
MPVLFSGEGGGREEEVAGGGGDDGRSRADVVVLVVGDEVETVKKAGFGRVLWLRERRNITRVEEMLKTPLPER